MTSSVVHDDVGFAGGEAVQRALPARNGMFERADGHGALWSDATPIADEHDSAADRNDRRFADERREFTELTHARLLLSGPSRYASELLTYVKFKPLILTVNTATGLPLMVAA